MGIKDPKTEATETSCGSGNGTERFGNAASRCAGRKLWPDLSQLRNSRSLQFPATLKLWNEFWNESRPNRRLGASPVSFTATSSTFPRVPLDRVFCRDFSDYSEHLKQLTRASPEPAQESSALAANVDNSGDICKPLLRFQVARPGSGCTPSCVACRTPCPTGVGMTTLNGTMHAGARDRNQPGLHVALIDHVLDRGPIRHMARQRREIDRADQSRARIARYFTCSIRL